MGEKVNDDIAIAAPVETVWNVITDLESYPQWAEGVIETQIESTTDEGYPYRARFRVDARVAEVTYVLEYRYEDWDILWELVEGETISQLDGTYRLFEDEDGGTAVDYTLEVDLDMPIPHFLKKRAARHILEQGLRGLKHRSESR
jgi:ribosome-associated toxin RatA of RatAB toxin-antitoxin module